MNTEQQQQHSIHLSRDDMQHALAQQSREQVLDSLEQESTR